MPRSIIEGALGSRAPADDVSNDKGQSEKSAEELEIEKIAEGLNVCIKLVGCGGAGSNTVNRFFEQGVSGVQTLAINTDAKHLLSVKASRKILIGKTLTRGLGAGAKPEVGERAAMEN